MHHALREECAESIEYPQCTPRHALVSTPVALTSDIALDLHLKFLTFQTTNRQSINDAFILYGVPHTTSERIHKVFPSGFYTAFGVKTVQKYKIFLNPKLPQQVFFKKMYGLHLSLYIFQKKQKCENAKMRTFRVSKGRDKLD